MRVLLAYAGGNSLGRAYCLWLLARELGWDADVFGRDGHNWTPLAGTGMAVRPWADLTPDRIAEADALIVYQPLPETFGALWRAAHSVGTSLLVDVDDPHWEGRYGFTIPHQVRVALGMLRRGRSPLPAHLARFRARRLPALVASPFHCGDWRDEALIPHVRNPCPKVPFPDTDKLTVAFIGTPRTHKGIEVLRSAVAQVPGVELVVTASPPEDRRLGERWVGSTTLAEGRELLLKSHVSAALQETSPWTRRQFPVKVVDGMMCGRVVLTTDLPPARWALNSTGVLLQERSPASVATVLRRFRDDRDALLSIGSAARREAESRFTPAVVAPSFADAVERACARHKRTLWV